MQKTKTKAKLAIPSGEYIATIFFYPEDWNKLPEKRRNALARLAADFNPSAGDQVALSFRRDAWFAFCGEVYALMLCGVGFTLDTGAAESAK